MDFATKKCVPCEGGTEPLTQTKAEEYLAAIPGWVLSDDFKKISREFQLKDFMLAVKFVNQIADIAESEGHHPDLAIFSWNHVRVQLWTHAIGGLSDNDFIVAAKVNQLWGQQPSAKA